MTDALFLSYYEDIDRWHNDHAPSASGPTGNPARRIAADQPGGQSILARTARQSVAINGNQHDLSRYLSVAGHGDTREYRRYDSFAIGHLSGKYYESLGARHGFDVRHVNLVTRVDLEQLGREVDPRWIMLSSTFATEPAQLLDAVQHVRRAFPDVPICMGGLFIVEVEKALGPRDFQRLLLSLRCDVYAVTPLGEAAFLELLGSNGGDLETLELPGSWIKRGARYVKSDAPEPGLSIDDNYVRWDQVRQDGLYHTVHTRTARSCAFECSFCSYPANQGRLTLSAPETLRAELETMRRTGKIRSVIFTDDTFNVPMPRFKELCRVLTEFDVQWYSYFRSQFADEDTIKLMEDSGCQGVFLGFESIDDVVLKNMTKAVNRKAYERGAGFLKESSIMTHANFIVGFPGDRPENAEAIFDFLDTYEPDTYYVTPWFCSPATPISSDENRKKFGIEGNYYRWSHDTMNSDQAMEIEEWAINRAKTSVWATDLGSRSFWSMTQLRVNGFSREEARRAMKSFASNVGRDVSPAELEQQPEFRWLRGRLAEARFPEPPDMHLFRRPEDAAPLAAESVTL